MSHSRPSWPALLLLGLFLLSCLPARSVERESSGPAAAWLDPPSPRSDLDTLLAPPGKPLGGGHPEQDPSLSPDGRWLAYSALVDGNWDIWLRDLQAGPGELPRRLTRHVARDTRPRFSPNGRSLLFISEREDAAGDIWEIPLKRRPGGLRARGEQVLLRRPGAQDNPVRDDSGCLLWDEESAAGRRVMRQERDGRIRELARPASLPRPGHGGLYLLSLTDSQAVSLEWLSDTQLAGDLPDTPRIRVWTPSQPLLEMEVGADDRLWVLTLDEGRTLRPGEDLALPSQLWLVERSGEHPPRPLLAEGLSPRQISLAGRRLIWTEDDRPTLLWLEDAAGRFPAPLKVGAGPWLALARRHAGDALEIPLLQTVQSRWCGSAEADAAALMELRVRIARGDEVERVRGRLGVLQDWVAAAEARARLDIMSLELELGERLDRSLDVIEAQALHCQEQGWPGAAAEAWLILGRLEMKRGNVDQALRALLRLDALPDSLPEQAEALSLRIRAWERLDQPEAARGALRQLAVERAERPDLLTDWLRRDLATLVGLSPAKARLRLRERMGALGEIRPLRLALLVELSQQESAAGRDGREVAEEDLRLILEMSPAGLNPFEQRVWVRGQRLLAELKREAGLLDEALAGLGAASLELEAAGEPELSRVLRLQRVDWLLQRCALSAAQADWEPVEADARLALALEPGDTRAWRLRLEALARLGRLDGEEERLREVYSSRQGREAGLRGEALHNRAVEIWALGLLMSWRAEDNPSWLPASDAVLEEALNLDDRLAPACLTLSWNLSRELLLAEGRRGGLKGLMRELGRGGEALGRLRHRGLRRLEEPDAESLRDRAILLAERGLRWSDAERDPELAAALSQNLGNLHFSLGEFGALKARQAWERRLALGCAFRSEDEHLRFLMNLGIARQWSGDLTRAAEDLERAQSLAAQLNRQPERLELFGRLAMLAQERGRPVEAQAWLHQSLALENNPGQRALLWRNLSMVQQELGESAAAGQSLQNATREAGLGEWPMEPEQNWLRFRVLALSIPLWNFPGLYTGQGRLDWGQEEERALRQAIGDQMSASQGAADLHLKGLRARRKTMRRQGDMDGMLRLDLAISRELASLERWEQAASSYLETARVARELVLAGQEARALEGALSCALVGSMQSAGSDPATELNRLGILALGRLERFLVENTGLLMPEQRLRLELLRIQDLDVRANGMDPVGALLTRSQGLLLLEDLEEWRRKGGLVLSSRQRLALDLAWSRLQTATGDPEAALARLEEWKADDLPGEPAILVDWARVQAHRMLGRNAAVREGSDQIRRRMEALPAGPDHLLTVRRLAPLLDELAQLEAASGTDAHGLAEEWNAWWLGRRLWEQADPPFPEESWTNAWGNYRADQAELDRLLEERFTSGALENPARLDQVRATLSQSREEWSTREDRLKIWFGSGLTSGGGASTSASQSWIGVDDSLQTTWLLAAPEVNRVLQANTVLAAQEVALVSARPAIAGGDSLQVVPPGALQDPATSRLDARVICLDAVLHLVPGAPQASWLDFTGERIPLRDLMGLDLAGEVIVFGEVGWQEIRPEKWREGWLVLERLLAQTGLRQALLPGPGVKARDRDLDQLGLALLQGRSPDPAGWWTLGATLLKPAEREAGQRRGLEELILLGNEYRRLEEHDASWRAYRRALRLANQMGDGLAAGRLVRLGAAAALDGRRHGEALDFLLNELGRTDPAQVEWEKIAGRLVQLADLAGREEQADSLWERLVVRRLPLRGGALPGGPEKAGPAELRAALESRLAALVKRGAQDRAAVLARKARLMPEGEDPRRALFLARLYLDAESAQQSRECLQTPGIQWSLLDSLESLDALELRSLVALRLGMLGEARDWMERAASQAMFAQPGVQRLALHYQRRADLSWSLGQYSDCDRLLQQAEALAPADDPALLLLLHNTRGLLATELDDTAEASLQFSKALEMGLRLGDPLELSAVHNNISRLAQRGGRWVEALESSRRAHQQDSLSASRRRSFSTLRNRAAALRGLLGPDLVLGGSWTALPEGLLRQRRASAELGRTARELEEARAAAREMGEMREACRLELELAWLYLELGRLTESQRVAEACALESTRLLFKREALEARLIAGTALIHQGQARQAEDLLLAALADAEEETVRLAAVAFDPGRGWLQRRVTDKLVDLYAEQGRSWEALAASERGRTLGFQEMLARRSIPAQLPLLGGRPELESLLKNGLEQGQVLLGWHLGREACWAFLWQGGTLSHWRLPVARDSLERLASLHRDRILGFLTPEQTGSSLAELLLPGAWLIKPPARAWLLPQGILHQTAFESLVLADGRYLGESTALCRSGSLALLAWTRELPGSGGSASIWSEPLVQGVEPLEYTNLEAGELLRLFPEGRLRQGIDAGERQFKAESAGCGIRHFACHAVHDVRSPAESALLLAPGGGEDGRLSAPEIAALDQPCGLTVLSACETGLGREGEEASAGLPHAFVASGSRGVVASLWKVDDLATAILVKHFYRALAQGRPADLALQEAQREVRTWVHGHPAYWAAFCLTGQPRPEPVRPSVR